MEFIFPENMVFNFERKIKDDLTQVKMIFLLPLKENIYCIIDDKYTANFVSVLLLKTVHMF